MEYSDYELVYMVKESEEALSYMVKKYEPLFRKLAFSFVKKFPDKGLDVDDIVQQCRISLCNALDRFDDSNEVLFYSYLLVCLRRSIYNFARSYINKPSVFYYMDMENYETMSEFVDDLDVEKSVFDNSFSLELINFKHTLDIEHSCVFELRYNSFTYKEIAELLDINVKRVDNILFNVRKKLEKYFLFS